MTLKILGISLKIKTMHKIFIGKNNNYAFFPLNNNYNIFKSGHV